MKDPRWLWRIAVTLFAFAAAGQVLLSTAKFGIGLSPDSTAYIDIARSLMSGRGFAFHTGVPLVWWPPFYPAMLALVSRPLGIDPVACARFTNVILFAVVVLLAAYMFRTSLQHSISYAMVGVCAVLFSIPLNEVFRSAWSESVFVPIVLLFLVFALRYKNGRSLLWLSAMMLTASLACLVRYAGVALVLSGFMTVALSSGLNLRVRITRAFSSALLALVPLGVWSARNYSMTGTFFGQRGPIENTLMDSLTSGAAAILSWYAPFGSQGTSAERITAAIVILTAAVCVATPLALSQSLRARLRRGLKTVLVEQTPSITFIATYSVVLLVAATRDAYVESRTLSPIYVPLTLVLLKLTHDLLVPVRPVSKPGLRVASVALLVAWLSLSAAGAGRGIVHAYQYGAGGLNSSKWRHSETIACLRRMLSSGLSVPLYTNGQDALWELVRVDARELPLRSGASLSDLRGLWPPDSASVVVWLDNRGWRSQYYTVKELAGIARVQEIAHFDDGSICRVSRWEESAPAIR